MLPLSDLQAGGIPIVCIECLHKQFTVIILFTFDYISMEAICVALSSYFVNIHLLCI